MAEHSWFENHALYLDQKGLVYYKLLKPGNSITGDRYRLQLIRLSRALRKKRPKYEQRHDKVSLLHDNASSCRKKIFGNAQMGFYRTRRIFRTLLLLTTGYAEGCSKSSLHFFRRKLTPKLEDSPPKTSHFFEMEFENCLRDGKSSRQ